MGKRLSSLRLHCPRPMKVPSCLSRQDSLSVVRLFRYQICYGQSNVELSPQITSVIVNPHKSSTSRLCDIKFLDDVDMLIVGTDESTFLYSACHLTTGPSNELGYVVRIGYNDDILFSQSHSDAVTKDILDFKQAENELPFHPEQVVCNGTRRVICIVDKDGQRFRMADLMEDHVPSEDTLMST
jgi:hypothetical protein